MANYISTVATNFVNNDPVEGFTSVTYIGYDSDGTITRMIFDDGASYYDCSGYFAYNSATQELSGIMTAMHEYDHALNLRESTSSFAVSLDELTWFSEYSDVGQLLFNGQDYIEGSAYADVMLGYANDDIIVGRAGSDILLGNGGSDYVHGNEGNDSMVGGNDLHDDTDGADVMFGGAGNDHIYGCGGNDSIMGEEGNDLIVGGAGEDTLAGGAGRDIFVYFGQTGQDIITDFAANDIISINRTANIRSFEDIVYISNPGSSYQYIDFGNGGLTLQTEITLESSNFFFYG